MQPYMGPSLIPSRINDVWPIIQFRCQRQASPSGRVSGPAPRLNVDQGILPPEKLNYLRNMVSTAQFRQRPEEMLLTRILPRTLPPNGR